jgi:acetyl esterase/lipase
MWALVLLLLVALASYAPLTPASASQPAQAGAGRTDANVTYCSPGGVDLKMDIFYPRTQDKAPAPVALYLHGGGWTTGDKSWVNSVLKQEELTGRGYLVAAINYRLAPQYKWPAQIEDAKCAVRFLRANASKYNLDPNRIGAWGESAGGHLAALLGTTGPDAGFEGDGGYADQSSRVQAVVTMCGPADFTSATFNATSRQFAARILGILPERATETLRLASPVTHISADDAPFLIVQGEKDPLVPPGQARELYDKLQAAGVPATLVMVKNGGHVFQPTGGPISPSLAEIGKTTYDFFDQMLRGASAKPAGQYFAETGKTVSGKFLQYWQSHGGLAQQGFPISNELREISDTDGKTYTVQYFERAVFELHPDNQPPNDVLLSLLGSFRYQQKYASGAPGQTPNTSLGSVLFKETGKRLGGAFLQYWQSHGGLAQQGLPISDEFMEKSDLDGKTYLVQYFERAVFEYHPENQPPNDVLLSQLGTFRYKAKSAGK